MDFRPLPIGVEDFQEIIEKDYYYVDKTLFIKELLDKKGMVNLFTRPRRFGKTLNLSMLRYYFEIPTDEVSHKHLFQNLKISMAGDKYKREQEQYPVVSLSLKSAKQPTFEMAYESIKQDIAKEYYRHQYAIDSDLLTKEQKDRFQRIMNLSATVIEYAKSLEFLTDCLSTYHHKKTIILVDEYDVPLENAYFRGFYQEMIDFCRSLFESGLKSNTNLEFGVITGCLRISKESIFTGLNNLNVISILNPNYGEYFGFLESEVKEILSFYHREDKADLVKQWYDGYRFGNADVYNPWSVLNYISTVISDPSVIPTVAWSNSSSNAIVHELVYRADTNQRGELQDLINGGTIQKKIHEDITYEDMYQSSDSLWNFLFFTGYLKMNALELQNNERYVTLSIPNLEVNTIYIDKISSWYREEIEKCDLLPMYHAMLQGNVSVFQRELQLFLSKTISYMDNQEAFYHGFLLGILTNISGYRVKSNREAGNGRLDIMIYREDITSIPVILELKVSSKYKDLKAAAEMGLHQIQEQHYADIFLEEGYQKVRCYGIGFYRKQLAIQEALVYE